MLVNASLFGQDYFNKIIPFDPGNPAMSQILYENDTYYVPVIFNGKTVLISIKADDIDYFTLDDFTISRNGLCSFEDSEFYYFGKDRNESKGLELLNTEMDYSSITTKNIFTDGDYNFPTTASKLSENLLYCAFTKDFDANETKLPEFLTLNLSTNEETRVEFNMDLTYTVPWVINSTLDNNIFISSGIQFPNIPKRYGQLIKMDSAGNIIWRTDGKEEFENGSVAAWAAELSDSSIVQSYYIDKRSDIEFIANQKFELPIRLKWYSKEGDSINQKLIITPKKQQINYNGLRSGKGEYFFAYGDLQDWSDFGVTRYFSHLTKFSNHGDTIWTRNYQHADHEKPSVFHKIKDIFEHENGDISILASLAPVGEENEIWLYKVNNLGCYINEECVDMSNVATSTNFHEIQNVTLFPNPATDLINIPLGEHTISHVDILNQIGKKVISINSKDGLISKINIAKLPTGVYFASIICSDNQQVIKKFIKL